MVTVPYQSSYDRSSFLCKKHPSLENYIKYNASQDIKKHISTIHVLLKDTTIIGYYTLSNSAVVTDLIPENFKKKLPMYGHVPATLLGRLAVDDNHLKNGYGELLIFDAFEKCLEVTSKVASWAIVVDPIDEDAQKFYGKYDFLQFNDSNRMFIQMGTIKKLDIQ